MKRISLSLALLLCLCFTFKAEAQYKVNESFDGTTFPPTGWYSNIYISGSVNWARVTTPVHSGAGTAFANYGPAAGNEAWLVTPKFLVATGDSLSFWARKQYSSNYPPDSLTVMISTTDTAKASFTTLFTYNTNTAFTTTYAYFARTLNAYAGQQIYIAFKHYDADGNGLYLDDVKAGQQASIDVGVASVYVTGPQYFSSTTTPLIGTVSNYGGSAATFTVTRKISPGGYVSTKTVNSLGAGASATVTFDPWTFTSGNTYTIKDSTYLAGDTNPANDTLSGTIKASVAKSVVIFNVDARSRDSLVSHFNAAGLSNAYDETSTFNYAGINVWRTIILAFGSGSTWSAALRDSLKTYLDGGSPSAKRTLLIFGNDLGYSNDPRRVTTPVTGDTVFYRQYLHAQYWSDDWVDNFTSADSTVKGTVSPFSTISGQRVNDPYPDCVAPATWNTGSGTLTPALIPVTESGDGDSCCAIAYSGTNYNVFYGTNVYYGYVPTVSGVLSPQGVIFNVIQTYVQNNGGIVPVELASFSSSVNERKVTLNWSTVSEQNNAGFQIERKLTSATVWSTLGTVNGAGTSNSIKTYTYSDNNLNTGKYNYRLKQMDFNGNFKYYNLSNEVNVGVPNRFNLAQNYPNPFNPTTNINYDLPFDSKVSIKIFDITGKEVATVVNQAQTAGYYSVSFNASALSSGVYFYSINAEGSQSFVKSMKMVLVK